MAPAHQILSQIFISGDDGTFRMAEQSEGDDRGTIINGRENLPVDCILVILSGFKEFIGISCKSENTANHFLKRCDLRQIHGAVIHFIAPQQTERHTGCTKESMIGKAFCVAAVVGVNGDIAISFAQCFHHGCHTRRKREAFRRTVIVRIAEEANTANRQDTALCFGSSDEIKNYRAAGMITFGKVFRVVHMVFPFDSLKHSDIRRSAEAGYPASAAAS